MQTNANTTKNTISNATQAVANLQFTKQSFMGIELDILVGHPEHDLLFVASQVARAVGIRQASALASNTAKAQSHRQVVQLGTIGVPSILLKGRGHSLKATSWMFTESAVYYMLMKGRSPRADEFRKWAAEEVFPSIRKTGAYNVNDVNHQGRHAVLWGAGRAA